MKPKVSMLGIHVVTIVAAIFLTAAPSFAQGSGSQNIELENGTSDTAYPVAIVKANAGECGSDSDDLVLVYNTPRSGRGNPDNIRVWTANLKLRAVIASPQIWFRGKNIGGYGGYLAGRGLNTAATRVCVGSKGKIAGWGLVNDLTTVRLWYKK